MKIKDVMTPDVRIANPDQSIREAAMMMLDLDAGSLPVGNEERLVGMITDRDIAVRAVALGKGPDTPVSEVMTTDVKYCFDDEDTDHVAQNMGDQQLRRLPVVDRQKKLVGIVSLGDLATRDANGDAGEALTDISRRGGSHNQANAA